MSTVERPDRPAAIAAAIPAGPPPSTTTSYSPMTGVCRDFSRSVLAVMPGSIHFDVRGLGDLGPFVQLAPDQRVELLGRIADGLQAEFCHAFLHLRQLHRGAEIGVEPAHRLARRAG